MSVNEFIVYENPADNPDHISDENNGSAVGLCFVLFKARSRSCKSFLDTVYDGYIVLACQFHKLLDFQVCSFLQYGLFYNKQEKRKHDVNGISRLCLFRRSDGSRFAVFRLCNWRFDSRSSL